MNRLFAATASAIAEALFSYVLLLSLLTVGAWPVLAVEPQVVRYPPPQNAGDRRSDYAIAVLAEALRYAAPELELKAAKRPYSRSRALEELAAGGDLDVVWTMTSAQRERKYRAIRIPIYRGYGGYRLLLIRADQQERFTALRTGSQWRELSFAQVHDWIDTALLRHNGWQVQGVSQYTNLFPLLLKQRVDAVPRGVLEITDEVAQWQSAGLAIEQHWLLKYPTAEYFFVSQDKPELAAAIFAGMRQLQQSGRLDQLFEQHFADKLRALQLDKRRVLTLQNPYLPKQP